MAVIDWCLIFLVVILAAFLVCGIELKKLVLLGSNCTFIADVFAYEDKLQLNLKHFAKHRVFSVVKVFLAEKPHIFLRNIDYHCMNHNGEVPGLWITFFIKRAMICECFEANCPNFFLVRYWTVCIVLGNFCSDNSKKLLIKCKSNVMKTAFPSTNLCLLSLSLSSFTVSALSSLTFYAK